MLLGNAMFVPHIASTDMQPHCEWLQVWALQKSYAAMGRNCDKTEG
jgi:hypothetical protein